MKHLSVFCLFALILWNAGGLASAGDIKIGTIDMKRVFESYYKTKDMEAALKEERAETEKEVEARREEFDKLPEDAKKPLRQQSIQTPSKSSSKIPAAVSFDQEIREFRESHEKALKEQRERMLAGIIADIQKELEAKAKKENYAFIVDKADAKQTDSPTPLHSRDSFDLTDEVIAELNKNKPATPLQAQGRTDTNTQFASAARQCRTFCLSTDRLLTCGQRGGIEEQFSRLSEAR